MPPYASASRLQSWVFSDEVVEFSSCFRCEGKRQCWSLGLTGSVSGEQSWECVIQITFSSKGSLCPTSCFPAAELGKAAGGRVRWCCWHGSTISTHHIGLQSWRLFIFPNNRLLIFCLRACIALQINKSVAIRLLFLDNFQNNLGIAHIHTQLENSSTTQLLLTAYACCLHCLLCPLGYPFYGFDIKHLNSCSIYRIGKKRMKQDG